MTQVVVYTNNKGQTAVLIPATNVLVPLDQEELERHHFIAPSSKDVTSLITDIVIPEHKIICNLEDLGHLGLDIDFALGITTYPIATDEEKQEAGIHPLSTVCYVVTKSEELIKAKYRLATLEEIAERDVPKECEWHIVERDDLPKDRDFRNAWVHDKGKVDIHMGKARDIHRDKLRRHRVSKLSKLDTDYMKADELGDTKAKHDVAQQKQVLRDITKHPAIDAATTPDELKLAALELVA